MYKLTQISSLYPIVSSVIRIEDGACIPFDPQNSDYQAYLKFIEDGGVPLPAEDIV